MLLVVCLAVGVYCAIQVPFSQRRPWTPDAWPPIMWLFTALLSLGSGVYAWLWPSPPTPVGVWEIVSSMVPCLIGIGLLHGLSALLHVVWLDRPLRQPSTAPSPPPAGPPPAPRR